MDSHLRKLSPTDGQDVYRMLQEIPENENGFVNSVNGMSFEDYKAWLNRSYENSLKTQLEEGWRVPQTTFWLIVDGKAAGYGKIRHFLTEKLRAEGGHIGYAIVPSMRGKGLGKVLLSLLLKEAGALGIDRALITVRNENSASIRTALSNGGNIERIEHGRHYIWLSCK